MTTHQGSEPVAEEMTVGAVHERVNGLEIRFDKFQTSIAELFREVNLNIAGVAQSVERRFETSRPDIYKMAGVASVALVLAGAYFQLAKANIDDHNTFTNDKIATTNIAVTALAGIVEKFGDKVEKKVDRLTDLTIPKEELNARLAVLARVQEGKVDKDVFTKAGEERDDQIESLRDDNLRLRADAARKEDLAPLWETIRQTRDQVNEFQRKFIAIPAFPKYKEQ